MKLAFLLFVFFLLFQPQVAFAIEDPRSFATNKIGVHILFTSELDKSSDLINSNGGDWGYVTIPIQAGDKDMEKWQKFMNQSKQKHVIPIIRLATEGDYFNSPVWRKPTEEDVLDFANFLNSLNWPVKNRYIVIFNEVNRGDEWDGSYNATEYAQILNYATDAFKSLSPDFFIISAGLDNGAANVQDKSINEYSFMNQMEEAVPGIFGKIDGLGSHSYPNPGFSQPPWSVTTMDISSFQYERNLAVYLSGKDLPVFITETGWSREKVSSDLIASYFTYAFNSIWDDKNVVAVTPFLLLSGVGPFSQFSLLNENGDYNEVSKAIQNIPKTKGEPSINIFTSPNSSQNTSNIPFKIFPREPQYEESSIARAQAIKPFLKWILKISD